MKKIIFFLSALSFLLTVKPTLAQTYNSYIWQYSAPKNIFGTDDLKQKLESEVQKVINAGHLAPFRAAYGEIRNPGNGQFYWYHRYDTAYTLSLAYPYLSSSTQMTVKSYLQSEMAAYPLWSATLLDVQTGTRREPDELMSSERGSLPSSYSTRPKLFALYALWLYAKNTGDWQYIQNNWNSITSFYNTYRSEVSQHYTSIAGAIGITRLAQGKSTPDISTQNTTVSDINSGLNAGKNFNQFSLNSFNAYQFDGGEGWRDYMWNNMFLGFQFLDISPEIGRYLFDDVTLKNTALGTSNNDIYSLKRAEYFWPLWYVAQAPMWTTYFGEGSGVPPDAKAMIFPLKSWVQKEPAAQLRKYLDVPDALLGDYYYIQNLIRIIEAHGQECWVNILTGVENCIAPAPSIAPTPSSAPTPTPKPGDANNDNIVDGFDYVIWLLNYDSSTSLGYTVGDFNNDGKVDGFDYVIWLNNYGT